MGWMSNEKLRKNVLFLENLLSSYCPDEEDSPFADLSYVINYAEKYGLEGDYVPYGGCLESDSKAICVESISRQYGYFVELKQKLEKGVKICERFTEAIYSGEMEAFDTGDIVTTDNGFLGEDLQFSGAIEGFIEGVLERHEDDDYDEESAEISELTVSVEAFIDFLKEGWEYAFSGEAEAVLDFSCVYKAIRKELEAFLEKNYPNIQLVE